MSFLFSGLISIMSTDRGTIISPHISPTLSIDTDSKKPVINLVQNFPKARALPAPRPACVLWKWLSKSVIVNCVIACTALYCSCTVACIGMIGDWSLTNANHHKTAARLQTDAFKLSSRKNEIFPHRRQPIQWSQLLSAVWPDTQEADLRQWWNSALLSLVNSKF